MRRQATWAGLGTALAVAALPAGAAVLPEDRADIMYHRYEGGGVTIDGPALLVRTKFDEKYAFSGSAYVDMVSSASIDVMTTASPYKEERHQGSFGFDMLNGKTQYSLGYTRSEENDYTANTATFDLSQDLFGDLTTVSFGYSQGWDEVRRRGDTAFKEDIDRRNYRFGVTQILTPSLMMGLNYELITDEGFLNNPYRSVRYLDPTSPVGYAYEPERYPRTHTSNSVSLDARYYLPYRAAVHGQYRYYTDDWGIDANSIEVGYTHPWKQWIFEAGFRWYDQSAADFYADLYPFRNAQNFLARDKELSSFSSQMFTLGVTYELPPLGWKYLEKTTVNFYYDRIHYAYDDFRNLLEGGAPGTEPLYSFDADVYRLFFSGWF